jgi:hypothetical protein
LALRPALAALGLAALVGLSGCTQATIDNRPVYPEKLQTKVLDVQVIRDETQITMTNTSAQDLPAGRLWVNQWFSREFPGLPIGQTVTYDLFEFKDRYGDTFRAGGFFATQRPDRVVQVQVEDASGELTGLVAIRSSRD